MCRAMSLINLRLAPVMSAPVRLPPVRSAGTTGIAVEPPSVILHPPSGWRWSRRAVARRWMPDQRSPAGEHHCGFGEVTGRGAHRSPLLHQGWLFFGTDRKLRARTSRREWTALPWLGAGRAEPRFWVQYDAALVRRADQDRDRAKQQAVGGAMQRARVGALAGAISTILPRYITATRSETCFTTARSCAMNRIDVSPGGLNLEIRPHQVDDLGLDRGRRAPVTGSCGDNKVGTEDQSARNAGRAGAVRRRIPWDKAPWPAPAARRPREPSGLKYLHYGPWRCRNTATAPQVYRGSSSSD